MNTPVLIRSLLVAGLLLVSSYAVLSQTPYERQRRVSADTVPQPQKRRLTNHLALGVKGITVYGKDVRAYYPGFGVVFSQEWPLNKHWSVISEQSFNTWRSRRTEPGIVKSYTTIPLTLGAKYQFSRWYGGLEAGAFIRLEEYNGDRQTSYTTDAGLQSTVGVQIGYFDIGIQSAFTQSNNWVGLRTLFYF